MRVPSSEEPASSGMPTRRQVVVGASAAIGLVTAALPSVAAAASDAGATTTVAPYSESGTADPSLAAINAVPTVTTNGTVEVSGSDSF